MSSPKPRLSLLPRLRAAAMMLVAMCSLPCWSQQKVVLDGSTGMIPLAQALATAYQQVSADPRIEVGPGLGTGARLKALADGTIDVALASHGIKPEDLAKDNLRAVEIAKGAIVFAVSAALPLTEITEAQLCDLYSGKIGNWKALNGPDAAVVVLTRPPTEVDPEVIRAKIGCFKDLKEVGSARVMARGGDMAKGLAETNDAIGMTSMTVVEQSGGKLKALALNGVAPGADNVKAGRYALTRDFFFVVKAPPAPPVAKFLAYVLGPDGDRVILANGAIPLR